MQKALTELVSIPESERIKLFELEPILVTQDGEPHFVAQSLEAFESMVRRLRDLEGEKASRIRRHEGKLFVLRR